MTLEDLNYIACVTGPGSFTGIRIGVSAVRSMCYALGKPALGIHELRMLAYNKRADGYEKILCVTDGSNGTAYICEYDADRKPLTDCLCVPMNEAIAKAESYKGGAARQRLFGFASRGERTFGVCGGMAKSCARICARVASGTRFKSEGEKCLNFAELRLPTARL